MKDSTLYFLGEVLEQLFERTIEYKEDLERRESELDEGLLAGYYLVIGKLFNEAKAMGLFAALPSPWKGATPESLMSDSKQGRYTFSRVLQLTDTFIRASEQLVHRPFNLRRVFEEIISEGLLLKGSLRSEFDEGKILGYSFCLRTLYNQAPVFVPKLFKALPKKLRNFAPESISAATFNQPETCNH
jgi:hypothetical protein